MLRPILLVVGILTTGVGTLIACTARPKTEFAGEEQLVQRAADLRARGPAGLDAALARLDELTADPNLAAAVEQMRRCVDLTAGQRDAWASRLYWYTDLNAAKEAAAASGKPILSLRMLGQLTDEFSCANSRYFRTALYANAAVSDLLREGFVLHWQSVRPVPRVTIDFGDGRKLERTVTGNSAHYVLDASGRPLDVLPGLYGPLEFGDWLARCRELHGRYSARRHAADRERVLTAYHEGRRAELARDLTADLTEVAPEMLTVNATRRVAGAAQDVDPAAAYGDNVWRRVAALPRHAVELGEASLVLMRREFPEAALAGARAESKRLVEDPLVAVVRSFTGSIALDAVKNEYLLHRRIHDWYVAGGAPADFDALNERVYAELFLTPSDDPWLGLAPADAYTGLDGGGLTVGEAGGSELGVVR